MFLYLLILGAWWLLEGTLKNMFNKPGYVLQAQNVETHIPVTVESLGDENLLLMLRYKLVYKATPNVSNFRELCKHEE